MKYFFLTAAMLVLCVISSQVYADNQDSILSKHNSIHNIERLTIVSGLKYCGFTDQSTQLLKLLIDGNFITEDLDSEEGKQLANNINIFFTGFSSGYTAALTVENPLSKPKHTNDACKVITHLINQINNE